MEGSRLNRTALLSVALLATAATAVPAPARAQGPRQRAGHNDRRVAAADSLIAAALERARAGDTSAAIRTLERATRVAPNHAAAFYQRGVLLSRTTQLGMSDMIRRRQAAGDLKRALEIDRNNPFYLMELGRIRLKTPFLRLDAQRLFNRALRAAEDRRDPRVLAEVHWELGQIYERRFMTLRDRRMIVSDVATFDVTAAISNWRYARDFIAQRTAPLEDVGELDARQAEDHYRAALLADPTHEGAALGLLGLLYDRRRYEEMARTAADLQGGMPMSARIRFALGLALHRMDRDDEAQLAFDSALVRLSPEEHRDMTGLATILRRKDAVGYDTLSEARRFALDSLYWDVADPLRLTDVNEARVEFLARVAYADLRFTSAEFNQKGWKTDRGIIILRYGEPPQVATLAPQVTEVQGSDALGRITTVWHYPASRLSFVFVGPPAMNYAFFAGDFRAYAENARFNAPIRFDNLEASKIDSVPVQVARFRADSGVGTDVSLFADLPTRSMLREVDLNQAQLETGFFITDPNRRGLVTLRDSSVVRIDGRDQYTSRAWRHALPKGEFLYRVEAREPASGKSARGLARFEVGTFPAGSFTLSDILVARRLTPKPDVTPRNRHDFLITPNGSMAYAPHDTVFLYWENYGTARDSGGNGRLRVELSLRLTEIDRGKQVTARILGGIADAVGLTAKGDDRVSLRFERTVALDAGDRVPNYLALDLGDAPFGTYALELTVTDLTSRRAAKQQRTITLPRP